ncbi:SDR family oxidoreductase [Phycicoccus flavus]|uniref:SDR family oxidoreductase n=1 Tax=Phycicoccus flavus TaxID=2502783 RepID=A0A8T6R1B8_9MICO|nr:SDR family oxidoreductase [Phycicoccus flavus]NHA68128.1 SDR family oxidoreductase [Phycicoccus flavus]
MNVFVTGASGWVASAVVPELLAAGHTVRGLARSDASAATVEARCATPVRGSLREHDLLRAEAERADAVVHLAFPHEDLADLAGAARAEGEAVAALVSGLDGTGTPVVAASGIPMVQGRPATEEDTITEGPVAARGENEARLLAGADRGFRPSVVRLPRSVHGEGDAHGFLPQLVAMFREAGTAMYVGDGAHRWNAVHVRDAGRLFRAALEDAPAGSALHAVGDEGVPVKDIAEALGARLGLPVTSVEPERLGFFGVMQTMDHASTAERTRALTGWTPTQPGLLEDIAAGHYDG